MTRKAISSTLATFLLIAITIIAAIIVYQVMTDMVGGLTNSIPTTLSTSTTSSTPTVTLSQVWGTCPCQNATLIATNSTNTYNQDDYFTYSCQQLKDLATHLASEGDKRILFGIPSGYPSDAYSKASFLTNIMILKGCKA